jgi:menaquinone-dependent protoporphyrinogen oxidase
MRPTILVAYATRYGSTRQVADAIARTLDEQGLETQVLPAGEVRDLDGYAGVVLGSALYMGRPHADARRFLRRHHAALAGLPVAVFAMGPVTMGEHDVEGARQQLEGTLAKVTDVLPLETTIFGGVVDPARLRFPFNRMEASDARDWKAIETWARTVAARLWARSHVAA